jgi:WD40 repeat protein
MSVRMTEVATQRFIDNITSITPGALKGGLQAVDCRPNLNKRLVKVPMEAGASELKRYDELIIGGHDGVPRLYKMHRETKRVIGDDACKIREFEALPGRIFALRFSPDGAFFAAGSSSDGKGEARVYQVNDGKKLAVLEGQKGAVYTLSYRPGGKLIASAGFDGVVRLNDATTGKLIKEFTPMPLSAATASR